MTDLIRRNQSNEVGRLRSDIDRVFADAFFRNLPFSRGEAGYPAVDIYSDEEKYVVEADLPGYKSDDIEINVSNNSITITGNAKEEKKEKRGKVFWQERHIGQFARSFELPVPIQSGKVEAEFEDGILKVSLPKADDARPHSIKIKNK